MNLSKSMKKASGLVFVQKTIVTVEGLSGGLRSICQYLFKMIKFTFQSPCEISACCPIPAMQSTGVIRGESTVIWGCWEIEGQTCR